MEPLHLKLRSEVESLYEARPYPPVGYWGALFQRIRWEDRPTLNYRAAYAACFGSTSGIAKDRPSAPKSRILVAGCGTFEPVVVALANPGAEILAVDLSRESLRRLEWQARIRGLSGRIQTWAGDFEELPAHFGSFDLVIATGVLHHLPDPARGLKALVARTGERGVFRLMVYSYWGRALLYAAKALAKSLGISSPAGFRKLIETLPAGHPYKIYFHLYSDARTDTGLADGYLHPCDQPFTAMGLRGLLDSAGLEAAKFLHRPEGQPAAADRLGPLPAGTGAWERLALLEYFGELQSNFSLLACRKGRAGPAAITGHEWNEALPAKGPLHSSLAGRELSFDTRRDPASYSPGELIELVNALYLLPKGGS